MAWAIITIYISKCAQMNPQQLRKTSKFYSICKKCDIEKTLGVGGYHTPLGSPKAKHLQERVTILRFVGLHNVQRLLKGIIQIQLKFLDITNDSKAEHTGAQVNITDSNDGGFIVSSLCSLNSS